MQRILGVVGRGNFAQVIIEKTEILSNGDVVAISFEQMMAEIAAKQLSTDIISGLIHVGSGRELSAVIGFCQQTAIPLIQASTGMKFVLPSPCNFSCIDAPNLSIPILRFIKLLREMGITTDRGYKIIVVESHQSSKKSLPGTAVTIAEILGVPTSEIESIRDPKLQLEFIGVPEEYLDGHAIHRISIQGKGVELSFKTKIFGRDAYVHGILEVLDFFEMNRLVPVLDNGKVSILDLLHYLK